MYQVSFEYLEQFLSYGPRLKFLHDDADDEDEHAAADDNAAKAMTLARLVSFEKQTS